MNPNLKILDCTLRDGGYRTKWDFPREFISDYLDSIANIGVDFIETGFRLAEHNTSFGDCAYSSDEFLAQLNIPKKTEISVMLKAVEFERDISPLYKMFNDRNNSPVNLVRIAYPINEDLPYLNIAEIIKNKGYKTALNLTKFESVNENRLRKTIKEINKSGCIDIIYFADTFGVLLPNEIKLILKILKEETILPVGFHSHNDSGISFINSITAYENGAEYLDSTISGFGRGAGNLKTEEILHHLGINHQSEKLSRFISLYFQPVA